MNERMPVYFRLYADVYDKLKAKIVLDKLNMQKVLEIMVGMYLEGNKDITEKLRRFRSEKYARRRRYANRFDRMDLDSLQRKIEEYSPISKMDRMINEAIKEDESRNVAATTEGK
ncbi:hypothetical protein HYV49_05270 [Candidatus Pacearchaeota archaeon]|nr:hypothetical protein [Candidatus Pacearchaeota archaeon]